jgi:hypothetical protein
MRWALAFPGDWPTLAMLAGIAGGCFLFGRGFGVWRRKRTVEDTPRARVRSMALGRVALEGRAGLWARELRAPISGVECCWYRFHVEEERRTRKGSKWCTLARGDSSDWPFYLEDDTGRVLVQPKGAQMVVSDDLRETNPDLETGGLGARLSEVGVDTRGFLGIRNRIRVTESRLAQGDIVYVLGVAQTRPALRGERRAALQERVTALKRDPEAMKKLDTDEDGEVSADEWEVARESLVRETESAPVEDRVVVARSPNDQEAFLISDRAEAALARTLGWHAWAYILGGAGLALIALWHLLDRVGLIGRS